MEEDARPPAGGPASYSSEPRPDSPATGTWSVETFTATSLNAFPHIVPGPVLAGATSAARIVSHAVDAAERPLSIPAPVSSSASSAHQPSLQIPLQHLSDETPSVAGHAAQTSGAQARLELEPYHNDSVHDRDSLSAILLYSNALPSHGPIGEMLYSHETVFRNVPGSSLFWTKHAVTAALTRRNTIFVLFVLAVMFLYDTGENLSSIANESRKAECSGWDPLHLPSLLPCIPLCPRHKDG